MKTVNQPTTLGLVLAIGLISGCASVEPAAPTDPPTASAAQEGRSVCPGSVPFVASNLTGAPADALERLQGTYENDPGFLAVVFDGTEPIVVVDSSMLAEWQDWLAPSGVAVAPSCVDSTLLAAVHTVLPAVRPPGGSVSAGYDGLDDAIKVRGVDAETLVSALEQWSPGMGSTAQAAIEGGTLRVDPQGLHIVR